MSTTFLTMQDECLGFLGITQGAGVSALRTKVKRFLNRAARDFWGRYPWKERKATATVLTAAPYTTGTLTFTNGSTTVTGSGTTWVSAHTGMKIALSYNGPYYTFTRTGATTGTLDRNYAESTVSGASYVLYQDVYSLSTSAESILTSDMVLHREGYGSVGVLRRANAEEAFPFPSGAGVPSWWSLQDVSGGAMRIRVGPQAPDSTFWIRYGYLSLYTEMSADADECVIPERWRHYIIQGALREAYLSMNDPERARTWGAEFEAGIARAWQQYNAETPVVGQLAAFDETPNGNVWSWTVTVQ